jgi:hypothetical protein
MTDAELAQAREDWFRWFYERRCGLWHDGDLQCPIMRKQVATNTPPDLRFYPEAFWGRPENEVWFMAINPGQESAGQSDERKGEEREVCSNNRNHPTYEVYGTRHNLEQIHRDRADHYVLQDKITRASLGLITAQPRLIPATNVSTDVVAKLAILNTAHCKCPGTGFARADERVFWRACGTKSLEALALWKPRLLVCYGDPVHDFLRDVHAGHTRLSDEADWRLADAPRRLSDASRVVTRVLTGRVRADSVQIRVTLVKHPARNALNAENLKETYIPALRENLADLHIGYPLAQ